MSLTEFHGECDDFCIHGIGITAVNPTGMEGDSLYPQFHFVPINANWSTANDYCATNFGTSLATIRNQEDSDAIVYIKQYYKEQWSLNIKVWTGLHDPNQDGQWEWASGYPWLSTISFSDAQ